MSLRGESRLMDSVERATDRAHDARYARAEIKCTCGNWFFEDEAYKSSRDENIMCCSRTCVRETEEEEYE